MEYSITRTKRKTMGLYVHKDGSVEVRCPKSVSAEAIDKFVLSKENWLIEKVALMKERLGLRKEFHLKPGSKLSLLGNLYPIAEVQTNKVGFDGKYFYIPLKLPQPEIKPNIIKLYKHIAENYLKNKTLHYADVMNVKPTDVKINSAKTRWGSCSGKNSINFSWKLIMADEKTVDYVVVHELAHTIEHNHSKKFWEIVEKYAPDYEMCKENLKKLQLELSVQNWDECY